jgi:cell pole-organizing protein PopZ
MEEILASIRRIIADDQSRARLGTAKLVTLPTAPPEERQGVSEGPSEAKEVIAEIEARTEAAPPETDAPSEADPPTADEASAVAGEPTTALRGADLADAAASAPVPRVEAVEAAPSVERLEEGGDGERHSESGGTRPEALELAPKLEEEVARLVQDSFARDAANSEWRARPEPSKAAAEAQAEPSRSRQMPVAAAPEPQDDRSTTADTLFTRAAASLGQARPRAGVAEPASAVAAAAPSVPSRERGEAPRAVRPEARGRDPILSSETDLAVARAFNSLSRTVLSDNARTLEDLVTEMLRPLLKAWLDDNLPSLVERLVRLEIERVARGRAD